MPREKLEAAQRELSREMQRGRDLDIRLAASVSREDHDALVAELAAIKAAAASAEAAAAAALHEAAEAQARAVAAAEERATEAALARAAESARAAQPSSPFEKASAALGVRLCLRCM